MKMIRSKETTPMDNISEQGRHLRYTFSNSRTASIHDVDDEPFSFNDIILGELTKTSLPEYKRSPSAPHEKYLPLTQEHYQSKLNNDRLVTSKSYCQGVVDIESRDIGIGASVSSQRSVEERRRSYKESGYGGSSGGNGSGDTSISDDVFDPPRGRKLSRKLSITPELASVRENENSVASSADNEDNGRIRSYVNFQYDNTSLSNTQQTPDLEALLRESESNTEVSAFPEDNSPQPDSHSSPSYVPAFSKLGFSSVVSPSSPSPNKAQNKFDFSGFCNGHSDIGEGSEIDSDHCSEMSAFRDGDVDFYSLSRDEDQVLESPRILLDTESESLAAQTHVSVDALPMPGKAGEKTDRYTPNIGLRMPSIDIDTSYKTELEIQSIYKRYLTSHRNHELLKVLTSEERPEVIYSYIQRLCSESESSCSSGSRSSLGSLTSQLGTNVISHTLPSTIAEYPSFTSTDQNDSDARQNEEWKKLYSVTDSSLLTQLMKFGNCDDKGCKATDCNLGRGLLRYMEEYLDNKFDSHCQPNIVLKAISEHAGCCDELNCRIPFCTFFAENDYSFEEQIAGLQQLYFTGTVQVIPENPEEENLILLNHKDQIGHKEGVDWHGIARLGSYSDAVLAVTSDLENPTFIVVKKETSDILYHREVLHLLKPHPRITKHYWILERERFCFFASKFEGVSLADRISETGESNIPVSQTLHYLDQLASAVIFLHRSKIAYLNWTVANVILSEDQKLVKLCNLSCSVPLDKINEEEDKMEDLKMMLPPRIVPPELYQNDVVQKESDVWGLGCVSYQMLTGQMIYPEYRHDDPAIIRDRFSQSGARFEVNLSSLSKYQCVKTIVQNCLRLNPDERSIIGELRTEILSAIQSQVQ